MTEPTPIRSRRKYTRKEKLSAVLAADMVGLTVTAEQTGIAKQTIAYWLDDPRFGPFLTKAREDMGREVKMVAHLAWARVAELLPSMEARDATFAAEKASEYYQLLTGEATSRTESRELLSSFDDGEREAASEWLLKVARERLHAGD